MNPELSPENRRWKQDQTSLTQPFLLKFAQLSSSGDVIPSSSASAASQALGPHLKRSACGELTKGLAAGPWLPPRQGSSPTMLMEQLKTPPAKPPPRAGDQAPSQQAAGTATCALSALPTPPSEGKKDEEGQLPPPYSRAPTGFCAAVTPDEGPGAQEESLPLPIPSSPSMNTLQHPRARSSSSGGTRAGERHPEPGAAAAGAPASPPFLPRCRSPSPSHLRSPSQPRAPDQGGA